MQVYKCFLRILSKRKNTVFMYLVIFLVLCIASSTQGKKSEETQFEAASYRFAFFDEDQSEVSRAVEEYLSAENTLVEIEDTPEVLQDEIYNRNIHCALRVRQDFAKQVREGAGEGMIEIVSVPGTVYGEAFRQATEGYMQILRGYLAGGYTEQEALELTKETVKLQAEVEIAEGGGDGTFSRMYYFFKYLAYIYIVICIESLGPVLITFRKKEVRNQILSSSYPAWKSNLELYAGIITMGIFLFLIHIAMLLIFGIPIFSERGLLFMLNELCFLGVSMGIVFLVGRVVSKLAVLSMIANVVGLGMSFLGGVFVPLAMMGKEVVAVAHILPSYWYIQACEQIDVFAQGESLMQIMSCMGVELLFGVALVCVGAAYSRC